MAVSRRRPLPPLTRMSWLRRLLVDLTRAERDTESSPRAVDTWRPPAAPPAPPSPEIDDLDDARMFTTLDYMDGELDDEIG